MSHARSGGPAVVLVADRTISADYKVLLEGMFATMQTTHTPGVLMRRFLAPPIRFDATRRAVAAPIGLRRIEAALLADTPLEPRDVVVTTPEALPDLLGPWVALVGVSSSDPLGRGMSNTTTSSLRPGELYTSFWTRKMMRLIARRSRQHGFAVIAGGAGAWQWVADPQAAAEQRINVVFDGYFESGGPKLVMDLIAGRAAPALVRAPGTGTAAVRPIRRPSALGIVEISRGCGNGCAYCTSAARPMEHLPVETICSDLATNIAGGITAAVAGSEDFLRYGSTDGRVDFEALGELLTAMRSVDGLTFVQPDHANISSVAQLTDPQLRLLRRLLTWPRTGGGLWVNMGIESANGHLVAANGRGKLGDCPPDNWPELVLATAARMTECGIQPVFSVILGLPGETPADVAATTELVGRLSRYPAVVFPIFHEPVGAGRGDRFGIEAMRADHLELLTRCYEINFRRVGGLFAANQRAGGVSWLKRVGVQLLGRAEISAWRRSFRRLAKRIAKRRAAEAK